MPSLQGACFRHRACHFIHAPNFFMKFPILFLMLMAAALCTSCALSPSTANRAGSAVPQPTAAQNIPSWRSAEELVDNVPEPVSTPDSNLQGFNEQVNATRLARCTRSAAVGGDDALLRELVTELYGDDVDPGTAAAVLISANCGTPQAIVRELVAQGGDKVVLPVVDSATAMQGPTSADAMEQAAADGLALWRRTTGLEPTRMSSSLAGSNQSYSMLYFPLGRHGEGMERTSNTAKETAATAPDYGIYTFVLFGDVTDERESINVDTYRELLRVIETYVLAAESTAGDPSTSTNTRAHGFLLPVHVEGNGANLWERTGPELSAGMRGEFAAYLRAGGQLELAQRLNQASGPFLVSSLEPQLVPSDPRAPRLLVDLSKIGAEYMYSVVDAYDRPIPSRQVGSVEGLAAIRARLIDMFPDPTIDAAAAAPPPGGWVYLFGPGQSAQAVPTAAVPVGLRWAAAIELEDRDASAAILY